MVVFFPCIKRGENTIKREYNGTQTRNRHQETKADSARRGITTTTYYIPNQSDLATNFALHHSSPLARMVSKMRDTDSAAALKTLEFLSSQRLQEINTTRESKDFRLPLVTCFRERSHQSTMKSVAVRARACQPHQRRSLNQISQLTTHCRNK
jgi:hypothetical protein